MTNHPRVDEIVRIMSDAGGVEAVLLGGSRALGTHQPDSDWDLGVYYRGDLDLNPLRALGEVHPPGEWGRLMNGGAWLDIDGCRIDVLLRDLDAVEHWHGEAAEGRFEVDGLPGYVAGIVTYSLVAEAHVSRLLAGSIDIDTGFPAALRASGATIWRLRRDFSLYHADTHARRGSTVSAIGQLSRAVLEEAHARCCHSGVWTINEKQLLAAAGMAPIAAALTDLIRQPDITDAVRDVGQLLARGD